MEQGEGRSLTWREEVAWTLFGVMLLATFLFLLIQDQAI